MAPSNSRKRQTRITFTPMPSSSPAAKGYNKQIQERAAAVGHSGSQAKRRKIQHIEENDNDLATAQMDGVNDDLPTPAATMERDRQSISDDEEDEGSEPIRSTQRLSSRKRPRARQQPLDFSGVRSSDSFDEPFRLPSSDRPQSSAKAGMFGSQRRVKRKTVVDISSGGSEDEDVVASTARSRMKGKVGKKSGGEGRATRSSQRPIVVDSDDEEDDNITVNLPSREDEHSEPDDEDEDMPTTAGKQPRKRRRQRSRDSFISSSPPRAIDSDDDLQIIEQPRNRRRASQRNEEDVSDDESDEPTPRRSSKSRQEQVDLEDDLEFLGPSSDVEMLNRTPRTTQSEAKSKRLAALASLKRIRSEHTASQTNSRQNFEHQAAGSDFAELSEDGEDEEGDEADPDEQMPPISSRQYFTADQEDEDFIENGDEDDVLGLPATGVPIEFTKFARYKAKDLFKYAVEWMVQKKINPAFSMKDEIYGLTFRKLDDEVQGLAASKYTSSVWKEGFILSLKARPDIAVQLIDKEAGGGMQELRGSCDACNRTGHPASYEVQFQGKPYNPDTLEEVGGDPEDDEDDDSDAASSNADSSAAREDGDADDEPAYDHIGRLIPPANTIFYVGRFCMANAETAHSLTHWRYHLNDWCATWLIRNGYHSAEKVVERDRWSTKKRRKYANKVVDRMEREGVVGELWRMYREQIDNARNSKQGRYSASA